MGNGGSIRRLHSPSLRVLRRLDMEAAPHDLLRYRHNPSKLGAEVLLQVPGGDIGYHVADAQLRLCGERHAPRGDNGASVCWP